jgi:glycerol-3-phosphate dehydrogenase
MSALPPRARVLRAAAAAEFDVVVIGGGLVGAGVAHDAARRGFRTILIERDDFAAGTSSRSSRLVHGGVRYLEHGWFHLVFEASRERRRLLDNAPHLVRPLRFTWPLYEGQRIARWQLGAGLLMYDVLALYRNVGKHRRLDEDDVANREPRVARAGLIGGASYWDAATNDSRLTLATALAAERAGAVLLNHAEVRSFLRMGVRVTGVVAHDFGSGMDVRIRGRAIVNATGPWTDALRRMEDPGAAPAVRGTKGVHVLVPRARIGNAGAVTLLHPADERVVFVLPAGGNAILGNTDTPTSATPDAVRPDAGDVEYILAGANHFFPEANLTKQDVISAWAGIRPLIASSPADAPSDRPREHEIVVSDGGVIDVSGGKLTTYRAMAEEIVDVAADRLRRKHARSDTAHASLPGGELDVASTIIEATERTGDAMIATHLVHAHGSEWAAVWKLGEPDQSLRTRLSPDSSAVAAEVVHSVRAEHARTLADLLIRRTPVACETRDHGLSVAPSVARLVAEDLGWNDADVAREIERYAGEINRIFGIDPPSAVRRDQPVSSDS